MFHFLEWSCAKFVRILHETLFVSLIVESTLEQICFVVLQKDTSVLRNS